MKGLPLKTLIDVRALILVIGACFPVIMAVPAQAQDMQSRVKRLENEIETLSRAVYKGEHPPEGYSVMSGNLNADAAAQANIELRLSQLENEIRSITGRLEEISFQNRQFQMRMEKELADMKMTIEQQNVMRQTAGANNTPSSMDTPMMTSNSSAATIDTDEPMGQETHNNDNTQGRLGVLKTTIDGDGNVIEPQQVPDNVWPQDPAGLYERSFSFLRERNYDLAAEGFALFLKNYPKHDLAANSQYWLGETYYVRQQYERAAREFAASYQNYPDGPKGPDNLLKLGMSLGGLGKKDEACLSFQQLETQYPDAASSIMIRAEAEAEKLGC